MFTIFYDKITLFDNDDLYVMIGKFKRGKVFWVGIENPANTHSYTTFKQCLKDSKKYLEENPDKIYGAAYVSVEKSKMYNKVLNELGFQTKKLYVHKTHITLFSKKLELTEEDISKELHLLFVNPILLIIKDLVLACLSFYKNSNVP